MLYDFDIVIKSSQSKFAKKVGRKVLTTVDCGNNQKTIELISKLSENW